MVARNNDAAGLGPEADVSERMARRVDDLPEITADHQLLATPQPGRRLHHRMQVGQPPGQVPAELKVVRLADAVVGVRVTVPDPGRLGMPVVLAIPVGERMHPEFGIALPEECAGQPVMVDVRVRDDQPGDVTDRVAGGGEARGDDLHSPIGQVRVPDTAVDERTAPPSARTYMLTVPTGPAPRAAGPG